MKNLNPSPVLLLAEDDEDDFLLARDALAEAQLDLSLKRVKNGEELMEYLLRRGAYENAVDSPWPALILLDLNMPKKDGREALKEIKAHSKLKTIPVVILTTSQNLDDVAQAYELGANAFIRKKSRFDQIVETMKSLHRFWFQTAERPPEE